MPPTLSAVSASFVSRAAALLALTFSRAVMAQEGEPGLTGPDPSPVPASHGEYSQPRAAQEVQGPDESVTNPLVRITSVGTALPSATLERMLGPALKSSFHLNFSSTDRFAPEELFRSRTESTARIHVWVDTTEPRSARIYFANRDGTRYLVRDLERSGTLDEMDREAIAQAIEWSLQALSEGRAGLTREEAEELLSERAGAQDVAPTQDHVSPRRVSSWRRKVDSWLPEVALLHRWSPLSAEMPETQGPLLRVGVDRLGARSQIGIATSLHYQHPTRHAEEGVELELQTVGARIDARYLATGLVSGSGFGPRFGLGFDAVFASPQALDGTRFEAAESTQTIVPLILAGVVWQVRVEPGVRLEMGLGMEVDLVEVHYDLITAGDTRPFVSRWPARPYVTIGVAFF